ncbi:hypothetical protein ABT150_48165 [Streptomyces mirabilis]|uniref:hypothetical protein n=1 Tax=Streptomyces mirabilis TaxID=68239 RepID=UPI003332B24A
MGQEFSQSFHCSCDPSGCRCAPTLRPTAAAVAALLGSLIPESVTGLDFALTALFAVLALDAVRDLRGDLPVPTLAVLSALAARLLVPDEMLLAAFALFTAALLARHRMTSRKPSHA